MLNACRHAGKDFTEEGPVILATGGFGADFTEERGIALVLHVLRKVLVLC